MIETNSAPPPRLSVIIPCYNHGAYIDEAVNSVLAQTFQDFEIVVVNDGSTDPATVTLLTAYNRPRTTVIHTTNQGLAEARNNGIAVAKGEYILPLDADDRIERTFLEKAVRMLDSDPNIGIAGSEVELFGADTGRLYLSPYSFPLILVHCTFVCTSAFRRADWKTVGGYKSNLKFGHEDWDFWLSIVELGRQPIRLPEALFYYRKRPGSMLQSMTSYQKVFARTQMFHNHYQLYCDNIEVIFMAMENITAEIEKTQSRLSGLLNAASQGREINIADESGPIGRLVPLRAKPVPAMLSQ